MCVCVCVCVLCSRVVPPNGPSKKGGNVCLNGGQKRSQWKKVVVVMFWNETRECQEWTKSIAENE